MAALLQSAAAPSNLRGQNSPRGRALNYTQRNLDDTIRAPQLKEKQLRAGRAPSRMIQELKRLKANANEQTNDQRQGALLLALPPLTSLWTITS